MTRLELSSALENEKIGNFVTVLIDQAKVGVGG